MTNIITTLLLTLGVLLALSGVAAFALVWAAPDHDSLRYAQVLATTGRRALIAGLALYVLRHGVTSGPMLTVLMLAAALTFATYATRTSSTIVPTPA